MDEYDDFYVGTGPAYDTSGLWVTKDGNVLKITEMSKDHLENAIAMLQRKYAMPAKVQAKIDTMRAELDSRKVTP